MLKPFADYVVIKQEETDNKTKSGLYLPDSAKDKPQVAAVLAVGKKVKEIKSKDRVVYRGFNTVQVTLDKETLLLIKEEDVLARVD